MGSGQVLLCPYEYEKARLIVQEMTDLLALDLVDKGMVTDQIVRAIGYDIENLNRPEIRSRYHGPVVTDRYGRQIPRHAHGSENLERKTSSGRLIMAAAMRLFDRIVDRNLLIRRVSVAAAHVEEESAIREQESFEQLDLFTDYEAAEKQREQEKQEQEREKRMQKAMLDIKKKFGKNAILKGMNLEDGATTVERNKQIGGHKA